MSPRLVPRSFTQLLTVLLCGVFLFSAMGWWMISSQRINHTLDDQIALRAEVQSRQLAILPSLVEAVIHDNQFDVSAIISQLQQVSDADFITVSNEEGVRLAHPLSERIGHPVVGGDIERALKYGEAYLSHGVGSLGPSVRYITPIFDHSGSVVGMIKVGYLKQTLAVLNAENISPLIGFAIFALLGSGFMAWRFSGYVSQQMEHLEPWQLRQSLKTSQGVLDAAHEGLMAINTDNQIYLINDSANSLLNSDKPIPLLTPVDSVVDNPSVLSLEGDDFIDRMLRVNGRSLVVSRVSLSGQDKEVSGAVFSIRTQHELLLLSNKISKVDQYLESLRVTRHEYKNKLSSLAGLLQMGQYERALAFILSQSQADQFQMDSIKQLASLPLVSGLLLAKMGQANERGVLVDLEGLEGWSGLPLDVDEEALSSLIGNLFDNSIDAMTDTDSACVRIAMYETASEHVLSVTNNGPAIHVSLDVLCLMGYTSKPNFSEHGVGMYLVQSIIDAADGYMELESDSNETSFIVYFPRVI
ncbi:ATP-binding protein [Enterovibrio sp. 27052020O]|uniref:ATP-binding protein n=1 Tax=Enterovibrio sp. 27052020O TaxID=3241166 RepID=UPI00388E909C